MKSRYIPADRQKRIQESVSVRGIVKVAELSSMMGVSELTIRRDLDALEAKGLLQRTHGGAMTNQRLRVEPLYSQKGQLHTQEKEAIAVAAAALVQEGDTVLINSGSTTARTLRHLPTNTRVVTSNIGGLNEAVLDSIELVVVGGTYRVQSQSVVGSMVSHTLNQIFGSKAIIGVDGISPSHGLTTPVYEEAEVGRLMIERTQGQVIVVADHSKVGVVSNFLTATMDKVDTLITDEAFSEEFRHELERVGVEVIIAPNIGS